MKRAILACVVLAATTAHADVGVVVTGEATLQPQLASQLEGWLKERGHVVQPSSLEPDAINTLIDCFVIDDIGCARAVVEKRAKAQTIVFARVEMTPNRSDGSRDIAISGYWLAKGHEALQERRTCKRCTEKQMRATADDLMLALAAEPPTTAGHGAAPKSVAQAGAPTGSTELMAPSDDTHDSPSNVVPIAITAVGGVALVGGIAMIATGGPPGADKQFYRDYRTPGYVVAGAGAVALGVGVYLLLRPTAHSAPVAAIGHDGAVFGWSGRF
jgi:hypothetical protein